MYFDRILEVAKAIMPFFTGVGTALITGLILPGFLEWRSIRKVRCCYRSLLSSFDEFCRSLGSGSGSHTIREEYFDKDAGVDAFIKKDQSASGWMETNFCHLMTALNSARVKAGLESRNFYFSRHFIKDTYGELLVVLTVSGNTAEIRAFCRGQWVFPEKKKILKTQRFLRKIKTKFFGYDRPGYSIMLV
jgi:hypothetical protein